MAGITNDVIFGKNADFSHVGGTGQKGAESRGLFNDGQIWIGSTSTNVGGTHVNVGNIVSPNNSITFGYSSPNITATVNPLVVQDLHTARFIVSAGGLSNGANFTTIAAAIAAASSGDLVFIQEGTYTENLTLKAGVNLCAYGPAAGFYSGPSGKAIINGTCTFTGAGTVGIYGIVLQTNSAAALAVTGNAASIVILQNCYLNCTNNTGVTFSSSSSSARIQFEYCEGDLKTTGIALFSHSSSGALRFVYSAFGNTGVSTTNNTVSAGSFFPNYSAWGNGTTLSNAAAMNGDYVDMTMQGNQTALTTTNTSTFNIQNSTIASNTSSCISLGAGTTGQLHYSLLSSSNATTVTGTGTLQFSNIAFNSVASLGAGLTLSNNAMHFYTGISQSPTQPAFLATHSVAQNGVTGAGATVIVNFTTEVFDQNSNFDATNTFTAPVTGQYQFNSAVRFENVDITTNSSAIIFVTSSNRTLFGVNSGWVPTAGGGASYGLTANCLVDMDAGDTCIIQAQATGQPGNTINLAANVSGTYFSGYLVC